MKRARGVCPLPDCGREVPLRLDGTVHAHCPPPRTPPSSMWCHGSHDTFPVEGTVKPATIDDLIEASSLGTPEAKAIRALVPDEAVRRVVARAREIGEQP